MQFKDLPECAQHTACNLLSGIYQERTDKSAAAKEIRDAFIALYSEAENTGVHMGNIHSNCAVQPMASEEAEKVKEDFKLYINGAYIPSIIERRAMIELGEKLTLSTYRSQVHHALQLAKVLHAKKDENGHLTEADFYDANKAIFQLASTLNQMQKLGGEGRHVEGNQ